MTSRRAVFAVVSVCTLGTLGCSGELDGPVDPASTPPGGEAGAAAAGAPPYDMTSSGGSAGNGTGGASAAGASPVEPAAAPVAFRRLTAAQFRNSLRAITGREPPITPLEPDPRASGLAVIDAARVVTSATGVEQYQAAVEATLDALFADAPALAAWLGCAPAAAGDACIEQVLTRAGRIAFRRTLTATELARYLTLAQASGTELQDPTAGLRWSLSALLQSPKFLYRSELGSESLPDGRRLLTPLEQAAKLAYFLWDGPPDAALIDAAEGGALVTPEQLHAAAQRLLGDPLGQGVMAAFPRDLFWLDRLDTVAKDTSAFPQFTPSLRAAMKQELLLKWQDVVFTRDAGLSELLVSTRAFVNDELAAFYGISAPSATADAFVPVEMADAGGRVGVLGSAGWLTLQGNQLKGSATLRGKFVRELILCSEIPDPPDNIDITLDDPEPGIVLTQREILAAHATNPACAGCHSLMDPLGFAFEHFDAVGAYREMDQGLPIDDTGTLDGVPFVGLPGLAQALANSERAQRCLVEHLYAYALGAVDTPSADAEVGALTSSLAANGGRIRPLLLEVALSEGFRHVSEPAAVAPGVAP